MLSDEEYIDMMESVISSFCKINSFNDDDYDTQKDAGEAFEEACDAAILEQGYYHFSEQDKDLLVEYAPKLFTPQYSKNNSYQIELKSKYTNKELSKIMLELAECVGSYRYDKLHNIKSKEIYKPREKNKKPEDREGSFVNHINAILDFIGRVDIPLKDSQNIFRSELIKARNAPKDYVKPVKLKTIKVHKDLIRQYLYSLKLEGKKENIDQFISALK